MSTSDRRDNVDMLLREAGASWRASQPAPPPPDLARLHASRPHARLVPALAAASIAAIAVATTITMLPDKPPALAPKQGNGAEAQYLVRNGDRVEVTGLVIAAPDRPVVYCPPLPTPSGGSGDVLGCSGRFEVTLTGVDLGRLAEPSTKNGVRIGYARLRGVWHDRSIAVDEQATPAGDALYGPPDNDSVPCPTPAGGWPVPDPPRRDLPSAAAVQRLAEQQPERFGAVWVAFPHGIVQSTAGWTVPAVLVVNLLQGDVDQARRELEPLYDGTICITRSTVTTSRLIRAAHDSQSLWLDRRNGIWEISGVGPTDATSGRDGPIDVHLLVVDERLFSEFQKIGFDLLSIHPAIRPIR